MVSVLGSTVPLPGHVAQAATQAETVSEAVTLTLTQTTDIVTDVSGYSATVKIKNSSATDLAAGTLSASTSSSSFSSSTSMQNWADGISHPPTPTTLEIADVAALGKGETQTISISLDADDAALARIHSWGAKPLLFSYTTLTADTSVSVRSQLRTYLTRSHDGLKEAKTPALSITTVLPMTSVQKTTVKDGISALVTDPAASTAVTQDSTDAATETQEEVALAAKHSSLRVVADPDSLANATGLARSSLAGLMQPYGFDITARALVSSQTWALAGIADSAWNSTAAHSLATARLQEAQTGTSSDGDADPDTDTDSDSSAPSTSGTDTGAGATLSTDSLTAYAWEGKYSWNDTSLALAKKQGYSTVISETAQRSTASNVVSGRQTVETDEGTVTVLIADETLSGLAQGRTTSDKATAESSQAGRLARFVAQTALFQMQRPYVSRNLLVSLGDDPSTEAADDLLTALETADWISQGTLKDLVASARTDTSSTDGTSGADASTDTDTDADSNSDSDLQPDEPADAENFTLTTVTASGTQIGKEKATLEQLGTTTSAIERLRTSVIKESAITQDEDGADTKNSDPQALSRQNAQQTQSDQVTAVQWLEKLSAVHSNLGLMAFGATGSVRTSMLAADAALAKTLFGSIEVVPPSSINVFSETAQTPVTVKNMLPFPISIKVRAATDSNAILITHEQSLEVPDGSEAQTTFKISVVGTGSATATFTPSDRDGQIFGTAPSTVINSQLTINDMSGNILIIIALLLGAVGIYRQATRRKDPDQ